MYKIPLYSKTPEYTGFPEFYDRAKGVHVWIKGKKYLDMCHHLGNTMLGTSNNYVNHHVKKCIDKGNTSLLNHRYMEKLSNLLLGAHQWADAVRFCNSGGEAMKLALDLAEEKIKEEYPNMAYYINQLYGYNGWHIKNIKENGKFKHYVYNKINDILKRTNRPEILVFELIRHEYPKPGTIALLKKWQEQGTILVLDEITSGFKFNCGGAHLLYDLEPDICVFSKAIGNGYPISVIIGKERYMKSNLFISSTNWTDGIGFVAGYHTIKALKHCNYRYIVKLGSSMMQIWRTCANANNVKIKVGEVPSIANFEFEYENKLDIKAYFIQEMLKEGILASDQFYPSFAHKWEHIKQYTRACNKVFGKIRKNFDNIEKLVYNKLKILDK